MCARVEYYCHAVARVSIASLGSFVFCLVLCALVVRQQDYLTRYLVHRKLSYYYDRAVPGPVLVSLWSSSIIAGNALKPLSCQRMPGLCGADLSLPGSESENRTF
jgi:hypothetical protein